ncbi:hypothetical protein BVX94_01605 [bacterium B17]|nr:hypothetical protein BVX94_01605 [bacterium B17]
MPKKEGLFEFKHQAQSYFGISNNKSATMRSCVIIEDTPRPYLNWLLSISEKHELRHALVLPFCDKAIDLLCGKEVEFGGKSMQINDLSQCVAILDMHNDPARGQIFDGFDPENPEQAGINFWQRIPGSNGINFLIASRYSEATFDEIGLSLAFTQIIKSDDMENPNLPDYTCEKLDLKLSTIYSKADMHAKCFMRHESQDRYALRYYNQEIKPSGKPVARLFHLLSAGKISNNELCKLSGGKFLADAAKVGKGNRDGDGRIVDSSEPVQTAKGMSYEERKRIKEMYETARDVHHSLTDKLQEAKKALKDSENEPAPDRIDLQKRIFQIRCEAEDHFQKTYGCAFGHGIEVVGNVVEQVFLSEEEREQMEEDHEKYQAQIEPLIRKLQKTGDESVNLKSTIKDLKDQLKAIGKQRDDLWRQLGNRPEKPQGMTGEPNPDETIRADFFGVKSDKRGLYYRLAKAGASQSLIDHFKQNIVQYGKGIQYIGSIDWVIE